jgi:RND family efflux transporter MFP subunit
LVAAELDNYALQNFGLEQSSQSFQNDDDFEPPPDKTINRQRGILLSHPVYPAYTFSGLDSAISKVLRLLPTSGIVVESGFINYTFRARARQINAFLFAFPARMCSMNALNVAVRGVLSTLLLGMVFITACSEPEVTPAPPKKVKAMRVADASTLAERNFPGRARAAREANLSFRVSGPLIELGAKVGDEVKQGDVLARIDPNDFQTRVNTKRGELERGIVARDLAAAEFKRAADIRAKNPDLISASEFDQRRGARGQTQAQVMALEAALKLTQDDLVYTSLLAPYDGVIAATYVENFENVLQKAPIVRLLDTESIEVVIHFPERLIGYMPYLVSATVSFDALEEVSLVARVKEVGSEASAVTRTFPVTLIMDQPAGNPVRPGMAADVRMVGRLPEQAREVGISIPAAALFAGDDANQSYVFIVDESSMTLNKRQVEVSLPSTTGILVKSGLEVGEWLVIAGVNSVSEGQQVRIMDANAGEPAQ